MKYIILLSLALTCMGSTAFAAGASQKRAVNIAIGNNITVVGIGNHQKASFGVINNKGRSGSDFNITAGFNTILINNGDKGKISIGSIFR